MLLAGRILSLVDYSIWITSRFFRNKRRILAAELISSILQGIYLYLLGSLTGSIVSGVAFTICLLGIIKNKRQKKWLPLYVFYLVVYLAVLFLTYDGIASILICLCSIISLTHRWWFNPQGVRFASIISGILYMTYQFVLHNPFGALELFSITASLVSFIKYKKEEKGPMIKISEPLFVKLPGYGKLYIWDLLLTDEILPIAFTCINPKGEKYIFYEIEDSDAKTEWLVSKVDKNNYDKILKRESPIQSAYRNTDNPKIASVSIVYKEDDTCKWVVENATEEEVNNIPKDDIFVDEKLLETDCNSLKEKRGDNCGTEKKKYKTNKKQKDKQSKQPSF